MAHPVLLRGLMDEYRSLAALDARRGSSAVRQRMDDLAYTLCVSTGTNDVDAALIAGRFQLSGAQPEDDSLVTTV